MDWYICRPLELERCHSDPVPGASWGVCDYSTAITGESDNEFVEGQGGCRNWCCIGHWQSHCKGPYRSWRRCISALALKKSRSLIESTRQAVRDSFQLISRTDEYMRRLPTQATGWSRRREIGLTLQNPENRPGSAAPLVDADWSSAPPLRGYATAQPASTAQTEEERSSNDNREFWLSSTGTLA